MKHVPSDKYNIAWFKLAECVSRGEKERALGVYRLLAHSFDDPAYALQLEGDILLSFQDMSAIDRYIDAAVLYKKEGRIFEAASVYEHLLLLAPDTQSYVATLVELYRMLGITRKIITYQEVLFNLFLDQKNYNRAADILQELDRLQTIEQTYPLHEKLIYMLLEQSNIPRGVIISHIEKAIDGMIQSVDTKVLQQFIKKLEVINSRYYAYAQTYLADTTGSATIENRS